MNENTKLKPCPSVIIGTGYSYQPELWAWIPGYKGRYRVSTKGRVYSYYKKGLKKQYINESGYYAMAISKNDVQKTIKVHRCIAKAFIKNPDNKECVNHKNGDRADNRVSNLEWVTNAENIRDGVNRFSYNIGNARECRYVRIHNNGNRDYYNSLTEASASTGYSIGRIVSWAAGRIPNNKNCRWEKWTPKINWNEVKG